MSDVHPQAGDQPRFQSGHHAIDDVSAKGVLGFGMGLAAFWVIVFVLLIIWLWRVESRERTAASRRPTLLSIEKGQYPGPELQDNPARERPDRERKQQERLNGYGWVERDKLAHIPIDRAMALTVERGVAGKAAPSSSAEPTPADAVRRARSQPQPSRTAAGKNE